MQERFAVSHSDLCFVRSHVYLNKEQTRETFVSQVCSYFLLLCLFFLSLFLRLCVDILCLFFFFPLGIASNFYGLILLFIISSLLV